MATKEETIEALMSKDHLIHTNGWFKSFMSRLSEDNQGNPIPWYTYSSVKFIEPRLNKDMDVFEFGSGHSTLWYGKRVNSVVAIEDKLPWLERIKEKKTENVRLYHREGLDYPSAIKEYFKPCLFDIIVIDGEFRDLCASNCLAALKRDGIVIWDNSGNNTGQYFINKGFRRLDFYGLTPVCTYENCTTIFYRENNCFNI